MLHALLVHHLLALEHGLQVSPLALHLFAQLNEPQLLLYELKKLSGEVIEQVDDLARQSHRAAAIARKQL